jgi:phospholipid/cholesterol/gamma-HCH transport system ATP-binding protein
MTNNKTDLVRIEDIVFKRGERSVFANLSLLIPRGKVTAILGSSGAGKTTILNLIGGRIAPEAGHVYVDNQDVHQLSTHGLYALRKRMGMLFQSGALLTDLNVFDNVAFPVREHTRLPESIIRHLVLLKLELVGLRGARGLMPSELSGGMARRVALARAIVLDPMMVMYDEPFAGLDPISMGVIVKLIRELNDVLSMTSVIVTHDVHEACSIADYVYLVGNGKVIAEGDAETMLNADTIEVKQFMSGLPDGPVPFHYPAKDLSDDFMKAKP